jgi:CheY-like chemotaxis protein
VLSLEDNDYDVTKAKVTQKHLEKATQNIITQREKVKKDLATMDLELPSYDDDDGYQVVEHTLYG